jgi:hypothetical protein
MTADNVMPLRRAWEEFDEMVLGTDAEPREREYARIAFYCGAHSTLSFFDAVYQHETDAFQIASQIAWQLARLLRECQAFEMAILAPSHESCTH